eukprot:scaffold16823_cov64-Phaeocystis_antarctica.AAC.4
MGWMAGARAHPQRPHPTAPLARLVHAFAVHAAAPTRWPVPTRSDPKPEGRRQPWPCAGPRVCTAAAPSSPAGGHLAAAGRERVLEWVLLPAVERLQLRLHALVRAEEQGRSWRGAQGSRHHAVVDAAEAASLHEAFRRLQCRACRAWDAYELGFQACDSTCILVRSVSSGYRATSTAVPAHPPAMSASVKGTLGASSDELSSAMAIKGDETVQV